MASQPTPGTLPVFPLFQKPMFPGTLSTSILQDKDFYKSMLESTKKGERTMGLFLTKEKDMEHGESSSITSIDQIHPIGVLGSVIDLQQSGNLYQIVLTGIRRIKVTGQVKDSSRFSVNVEDVVCDPFDATSTVFKAYCQEIISTLREITSRDHGFREQLHALSEQVDISNPVELADLVAAILCDRDDAQRVLTTTDVAERLRIALQAVKAEMETHKIRENISREVEKKFQDLQRKHFLKEQMSIIQKELGITKDEKALLTEKFARRLDNKTMSKEAQKVYDDEMLKLQSLEPSSSEFNITRTYLDWLTKLPWSVHDDENLDLKRAKKILDADHYGLKDMKQRILEFIAVANLKEGGLSGKIICLVGPPGTGKTSVGRSIANATGRSFFRFSVGGMSDVSEIKGHRRTYVGAMPGKILQGINRSGTSNPVVLLDEIDKMGRGSHQGDPSSALLEVLDPEQNDKFLDHYLDTPYDLSKVLFICTANVLESIPEPLIDRMEIIRLSGYVEDEKMSIAKEYLIPKARKDSGIEDKSAVTIGDATLRVLISEYAREAGVRSLQKLIEKIHRKAAFKIVSKGVKKVAVRKSNLKDFVGPPKFPGDHYYKESLPVGVCTGLAWTSMGGVTLYIETAVSRSKKGEGSLKTTGQMGDVMEESTQIAYTYAKEYLSKLDPENDFFEVNALHMHIPEGATPKDGPSAGITMVTSLLLLAMQRSCATSLAMTGELTLKGRVLPIGGVKEKILASKRQHVEHVILPAENKRDVLELDASIIKGLTISYASSYDDVWEAVMKASKAQ